MFLNSALAFASAQLLMAALHEAGHGAAAQLLGFRPAIYAFYENNPTGSHGQTLIILAAGPVTSLVLGALLWAWYRRLPAGYSFGRLLLLWSALLGLMTFVNYLIVMPFLAAGDTAQIADLLKWPAAIRYGFAAIGVLAVVALARPAARAFFATAPPGTALQTPSERRRYIIRGFYLPLIGGLALMALAGIGTNVVNVGFGLLGTLGNIDVVAATLYVREEPRSEAAQGAPPRFEPWGFVLYVALVLLYDLGFSHGIPV